MSHFGEALEASPPHRGFVILGSPHFEKPLSQVEVAIAESSSHRVFFLHMFCGHEGTVLKLMAGFAGTVRGRRLQNTPVGARNALINAGDAGSGNEEGDY